MTFIGFLLGLIVGFILCSMVFASRQKGKIVVDDSSCEDNVYLSLSEPPEKWCDSGYVVFQIVHINQNTVR